MFLCYVTLGETVLKCLKMSYYARMTDTAVKSVNYHCVQSESQQMAPSGDVCSHRCLISE